MNSSKLQNAVEVLKLAVARIMRIDDALETNYSPEEISEILKDVQIKVQGEDVDDDSNLLRGTNKLMRNAIKKIDNLQLENQELKMKLSSMDKKIGEISKTVNNIQDDMVDSI
jgi:peptidoglycan hydrolase CwlO-like protein